ncbi:MAG: hypothetical protein WC807_12000 [Hyphomicrobium sp.]|jgi:hypothetical protein
MSASSVEKAAFGWVVEISDLRGSNQSAILRFNVAEPNRLDAINSVRRRVPGGDAATVEAVAKLSRYAVYNHLRLKRGETMLVA